MKCRHCATNIEGLALECQFCGAPCEAHIAAVKEIERRSNLTEEERIKEERFNTIVRLSKLTGCGIVIFFIVKWLFF